MVGSTLEHNTDKNRYRPENWRGGEFYLRLNSALVNLGSSLSELYAKLPLSKRELDTRVWISDKQPDELPQNFAPRCLDILKREWGFHLKDCTYNPCIHAVKDSSKKGQPIQSILRIRQRRFVPHFMPSVVLDASANPKLIEKVFGPLQKIHKPSPPDFPAAVHVRQVRDHNLSKTWLTAVENKLQKKWRDLLQLEISRYQEQLGSQPIRVGLLTFEDLEKDCKNALIEIGVLKSNVVTEHYWNQRGKNVFTDPNICDVLVVMGYPRPNAEILYEEACVLFNDEETPISLERTKDEELLSLANGYAVTVKDIDRYEDERVQALYDQKSRTELYQAFHRARPYLEEGVKEILVFTNVPIPDVVVSGFIGDDGEMFQALETLKKAKRQAVVTDMADLIFQQRQGKPSSTQRENLIRRIGRNRGWLTEATNTEFITGNSKANPSRFRPREV